MSIRVGDVNGHNGCYFDRVPEKLVLEGYRRWLAGYDTGSVTPWEMGWALYTQLLGAAEGRRALAELSHFVRTLRHGAACPLASFPFGAHHICRDECLALGLIAALQHDDAGAAATCIEAILPGASRRHKGSGRQLRRHARRLAPVSAAHSRARDRRRSQPRRARHRSLRRQG